MTTWPVLNHYEGDTLRQIAFPLGGIGTGTICLGGRAELRDFELFNTPSKGCNPPFSFFALWCKQPAQPAVTRILEGVLQPPYDGAFGVTTPLAGLPRLRNAALDACYPFARYTLSDPDVPLLVHLEAFNPLVPLDADSSGLPVAVLRYVLENPTDQPVEAAIAGSMLNFIGSDLFAPTGRQYGMRNFGPGTQIGGNVNEVRQATLAGGAPLSGLLMCSEKVAPRTPQDGTMALAVLAGDCTMRRTWGSIHWNRHVLTFWDDFSADGRLDDPPDAPASPQGEGQIGSLASGVTVAPHGSAVLTFLISWHFAHRTAAGCSWQTNDPSGGYLGNYYTRNYSDAWDVLAKITPRLADLEERSLCFARSFVESSLPQPVKEAALNNASTLRSTTCFRTADGAFFGFEGCHPDGGCCFGSCTHVWNYEQTTAFLFPELARSMRRLELEQGTLPGGSNDFRLLLPLGGGPWKHAAADGQMGVIMKCYREWQLGDEALLKEHWPAIRSLLSYCWLPGGWDADKDGVMEGVQHNTYDVEFFGPNPLCGVYYLGALRAGEEMAAAMNDAAFASECRTLYERGSAWIDTHLFNGDYYIQLIRPPVAPDKVPPEQFVGMGTTALDDPDFQVGNGCLVDQLMGQYMAHVMGIGYLLKQENTTTALQSLFHYNFRRGLYGHWNNMRTFAINDESALLICSWPHGDRPHIPFPYFNEAFTGSEYQAAAHMIYEGLVDEGLEVIAAIRRRFDGYRRNPWNEPECGHHYARAMAAWAAILALSGFHYSAPLKQLSLQPRWRPDAFHCLWTLPSGWGMVDQTIKGNRQSVRWQVSEGTLAVQQLRLALPEERKLAGATVHLDRHVLKAAVAQDGEFALISLATPAQVAAGQTLNITIEVAL